MTGGKDKAGKPFADVKAAGSKYYDALANSPFGNELLAEFAKGCIDAEHLGADDEPDLLTVSFSSNDLIGHTWGPDSHEVLDCTLRSDAVLAGLLAHLDAKVGKGKYAVILTADHGICPLPEFAAKHPKRYKDAAEARRVPSRPMREGAEKHLNAKFGTPGDEKIRWVEQVKPPYFYLNHKVVEDRKLKVEAVAAELAGWVRAQDGVAAAYTEADLRPAAEKESDPVREKVRQAFRPERSGDVYVVLHPYLLIGDPDKDNKLPTGTTHGAPHDYDTHVPLLVYGPGVKGGKRDEPVTPLHAAPVAAKFLGVPPPAKATVTLPKTLAE
jgi:arylsulfatase A-like enzyme